MKKEKLNIIQFMPYFPPHKWWLETVWEDIWKYWVKNSLWNFINIVTKFNQEEFLLNNNEKIIFENKIIWYKKDWYEVLVIPSFEIINNFPVYKIWDKKYWIIIQYLKEKTSHQPSPLEDREQEGNWRVITHTRFFLTSFIGWLFAKKNKIKWIHIEHGSSYVKLSSKLKSYLSIIYDRSFWKWIFKNADKVLAISEACSKFIRKEFIYREVSVIYRGVDLLSIENKKKLEIKLVFIWRLVKLKWVDDLLKAYSKLNINIWLYIIWDWEELQNLKNIVMKNNLNNINFLWFKDKKFITNYLSKNKCILINTSYQEGLPTSVIEGLFYNNIVIASNVWGTKEISNKDDLILFEAWDVDWLVKNIKFAIKQYDNLVWKSKIVIDKNFNWEKNIEKYYNLLSDVK